MTMNVNASNSGKCGKGSIVCLYIANALVYAFNALFYCLLPIYFNDQFPPTEAGILLSIGPAVSIIAPVFWGMLADRAKYKNTILICSVLCSAVFFFSLGCGAGFFPMCILVGLTMLFMSPFSGLIDTITLEYTGEHHVAYGPIRVMGTLGFGVISLISSFFAGTSIKAIFYIFVCMAILCTVSLLLGPKVEGHARKETDGTGKTKAENVDLKPLLHAKRLWTIVGFMLMCQFAYSYYCNYFPSYLRDTLHQPEWVWGLNVLILVCGEIPFFFLYNKLFQKCDIRTILLAALIGSAVRYLLLGVSSSLAAIIIINFLTGFLVTVVTYCGATYITRYIAPSLQATGQNLMYCIGQGIARVFGGIIGGMINEAYGTGGGMYLFGGMLALSCVICGVIVFRDPSPEWKKPQMTDKD